MAFPYITTPHDAMQIPLQKGLYALVDPFWYELLSPVNWHRTTQGYVELSVKIHGKSKFCKMHRLIMGANADMEVDHINGNKLDNRTVNLRLCTSKNNSWNTMSHRDSTSRHKGVSFDKTRQKWMAQICCHGKNKYLGRFSSEEAAARAYDATARRLHGEFAKPNYK